MSTEPTPAAPVPAANTITLPKPNWQAFVLTILLAYTVYDKVQAYRKGDAVDPQANVKVAASAYRKDEAPAYRRAKATLASFTGDAAAYRVALAKALSDERKPKASDLADALTNASDRQGALEALAVVCEQ